MKKKIVILCCCAVVLSGCMQSKEHITILGDGTGVLETTMVVSDAATQMFDSMMAGMMEAIKDASSSFGSQPSPPSSISDQMFPSKEQILIKAQKVGLNVEFLAFQKEKKGRATQLYYKLKFDDTAKLMQSGIVGTKFGFSKDPAGTLSISLESAPEKAQEAKTQKQQFEEFKKSDQFKNLPTQMQEEFMAAMRDFRMEFIVTLPSEITSVSGPFEKTDPHTARVIVAGDFLSDPSILAKLYEQPSGAAAVTCSTASLAVTPEAKKPSQVTETLPSTPANVKTQTPEKEVKETTTSENYSIDSTSQPLLPLLPIIEQTILSVNKPPAESKVRVFLKKGKVVEGKLIEETKNHVRIDMDGVTITFFQEEIERIERNPF